VLIQRGDDRSQHLDRRLAFILAAVAGSLNAAAFHAVGFFSANMTGNVSTLSSLIAMGQWWHGLGYLVIVLTFIGGAAVSSLTIDLGLHRGSRRSTPGWCWPKAPCWSPWLWSGWGWSADMACHS
jgi:uncharacterized membrane protein YoaK (UPF0700 family)